MKFTRITSLIILASLVGLFGVAFLTQGMEHGDMMNPCPYAQGMNSVCPMTVAHHAKTWLSLFMATPAENYTLLTTLILAVLIVFSFRDRLQNTSSPGISALSRFTSNFNPLQSFFSYLSRLFQTGILHPKVF